MEPRYFHVFNRGLDRRIIFPDESFYDRFLLTANLSHFSNAPQTTIYFKQEKLGLLPKEDIKRLEMWNPPLVTILTYCLMPNYFHFLLKEEVEHGMSKFMARLGDGYTKYFNTRGEREGRLFTAKYKRVHILADEQLLHVSRYIHLNPNVSSITNIPVANTQSYRWSSLGLYSKGESSLLCQPAEIMNFFSSPEKYLEFLSGGVEDSLEKFPKDIFIDSESE